MEDALDTRLDQMIAEDKSVTGLLLTDKQGLCIKSVGNAKAESSGIVTAINDLVTKLEPKSIPTVIMESDSKCCIIYSGKNMNAAVFKNITH